MKSLVPMPMRLVWTPRILSRNPTYQSPLLVVQTLACHTATLGVDYQRDGTVQPQSSFDNVSMFFLLLISFYNLISRSDELIVL